MEWAHSVGAPDQLRTTRRWILWRWARRGNDLVKVPTRPTGDGNISAFDPAGWMAFDDAAERLRIAEANNTWGSGGGVGFVFDGSDGLGGVDLDGVLCPESGRLAGWAREVVERFDSFTEISPSGTGIHVYASGAPDMLDRTSVAMSRAEGDPVIEGKAPMLEAFVSGRFFTFTGNQFLGTPADVRDAPEAWAWLAEKLGQRSELKSKASPSYDCVELATVAEALSCFSSDDVGRNIFVGFAYVLRQQFGEDAREVYADWMARSPNDDPEATQAIWESAHSEPRAMTLGSIFHHAIKHGWTPPWRGQDAQLVFDEVDDKAQRSGGDSMKDETRLAERNAGDSDKFAHLFDTKASERSSLFEPEQTALLAELKHTDRARYEQLIDMLQANKVSRLKELDTHVDKRIREAEKQRRKQPISTPSSSSPAEGVVTIEPGKPLEIARGFVEACCPNLRQHIGEWLDWSGAGYVTLEDRTVRQRLQNYLERTQTREWNPSLRDYESYPTKVTPKLVGEVTEMLANEVHVQQGSNDPPCWLEAKRGDPPAGEVLALANGLLHVPTGKFMKPTPRFFTRTPLEFDYDPNAAEPRAWMQFLSEVYAGVETNADLLQEAIGYLLLPDTSLQVIIMRVGPSRGGKGTELRIVTKLLGAANCTSQTLKHLGITFGLQSLIDKLLLQVTDAYQTRGVNTGEVASAFLRISGEDHMTIPRKHLPDWQGRLPTRIWVATTRKLVLPDLSGALINRYLPIVSEATFADNPDPGLEAKLSAELPGILLWALAGRKRLMERGHFSQTKEGLEVLGEIEAMANPVVPFIREHCVLATGTKDQPVRIRTAELLNAYNEALSDEDWGAIMSDAEFGDKLAMATHGRVKRRRPRTGPDGKQEPWYYGIRLKAGEND